MAGVCVCVSPFISSAFWKQFCDLTGESKHDLKISIKNCSKSDSNAFCFYKQIKIKHFLFVPFDIFFPQNNLDGIGCLYGLLIWEISYHIFNRIW